MSRALKALAILAALAAGPAAAHEKGGDRAMGIIASVSPDRLAIRTSDGHVVEFAVTPATRFTQGDARVGAERARAGGRAVVHGARSGTALRAVEVRLAPVEGAP